MNGMRPPVFASPTVGVANLATRWHEVPLAPSLRELPSVARLKRPQALCKRATAVGGT